MCTCLIIAGVVGVVIIAIIAASYHLCFKPAPVSVKGSHIVITGGSSGIGLACAEDFLRAGAAHVVLIGSSAAKLEKASQTLEAITKTLAHKPKVTSLRADVSNTDVIQTLKDHIQQHGPVDILVCSAGVSSALRLEDTPIAEYDRIMRVNYLGCVYSVYGVLGCMKARKRGRILFVSSMAGGIGIAGYAAYSPTKFALRGFAECVAMETSVYGIGVSIINPPDVDTPMYHQDLKTMPPETREISQGAGLWTGKQMSQGMIKAIDNWSFVVNFGFDGFLLGVRLENVITFGTVTSGMSPVGPNPLAYFGGVLATPIVRLVALGILANFWSITRRHRRSAAALVAAKEEKKEN